MVTVTVTEEQWSRLLARTQENRIILVFELFRTHHLEAILIKGWAAARNYPAEHQRRPGDIDVAVASCDFDEASKLLTRPELAGVLIDLHKELRRARYCTVG